jgi:uncharacterized lipoprotein YbaY
MLRCRVLVLVLPFLAVLAAGCARGPGEVTGTVSHRERLTLPADAVLEVSLEGVAPAGGSPEVVGVARVMKVGTVPIPFTVEYDRAAIDGARDYVIRARITSAGRLIFWNGPGEPVLTRGRPASVDLVLTRPTEADAAAAAPLRGMFTYMADAPLFEPCGTGRRVPVAMEGDYLALERAYTTAGAVPGLPMLATLDGRIDERPAMEGGGTQPTLVVTRFISISPNEPCGDLPPVPPPR